MNYQETIEFLFNSLPMYQRTGGAAYKPNLNNTIALDDALGNPHRKFRSVHIAGTNGKGSVSHMLASIFQAAGYRTGLYTSPHLLDFRERIRVNGEMVSEEFVVDFVSRIKPEIERISPSFFEMTVAMAFDYFAIQQVDIAIIETGMGGRLDSTNIIIPDVSVITQVSLDHTEFLGDTVEKIAGEKAGIIKSGVPVVLGKNVPQVVHAIKKFAEEKNAPLTLSWKAKDFGFQTMNAGGEAFFHYRERKTRKTFVIASDLTGSYQSENICTVLAALDILTNENGWNITEENSKEGFLNIRKNTGLRGRWEVIGANPRIICDTGHNEAGIRTIVRQLMLIPYRQLHIVFGMVGDKPADHILKLLPQNASYYFTQPSIPRRMPVEKLAGLASEKGLSGKSFSTVEEAFLAAQQAAGKQDMIFIGGSTFVVADLLSFLES